MTISEIYNKILRRILKETFLIWQRLGFHITPNHFYSPVPDTRTLKNRDLWGRHSEMIRINMNEEGQLNLLLTFYKNFKEEYDKFPYKKTSTPYEYYINNGGFESVDGEILYCMIRHFKPRKIFEIGSGNSTYLSAQAVLKNDKNTDTELIAFEPYPNDTLRKGFPGLSKLEITNVEDVDLVRFKYWLKMIFYLLILPMC